jgi:anti-sigma28 factor (negative regulator of flagellin synthesis)
LQLRQEAGEQLTEEELKIVNALRPTKKQQLEEEKKSNEDKKGGKAGKKEDKKSGKDSKKEEVIAKPVEHKPREWPKSNSNIMIEIQDFLRHFEAERVMIEKATSEAWVRSSDDLRSIEEGAHMANEERVGIIQRNIEDREMTKIHQK